MKAILIIDGFNYGEKQVTNKLKKQIKKLNQLGKKSYLISL